MVWWCGLPLQCFHLILIPLPPTEGKIKSPSKRKVVQTKTTLSFNGNNNIVMVPYETPAIGKISLTSPIVINVPTRVSLDVKTWGLLFLWLAHLNNRTMFVNRNTYLPYCLSLTEAFLFFVTKKPLLILYKSLVRPQLQYASQVWSPCTTEKIMALKHVQRCATKLILKCNLTYPEHLDKLGLLPLVFRREVWDLCFFFKCLMGHIDFDIQRNAEAILAKGCFRTDVSLFSFFSGIVDSGIACP